MRFIITLVALFCCIAVSAQKEKKVEAEYLYIANGNISPDEARNIALERAQTQAIADEFGTIISQTSTVFMRNENGVSKSDFQTVGSSDVKGEWIETIGEPEYEQGFTDDGQMWIKCSVKGRIREITSAKIDFECKVLRNGTDDKFEGCDFRDGDDMFVSFKSPANGSLAIYLIDDASQTAYCLLPYSTSSNSSQQIVHDQRYVFFSKKNASANERSFVDEMTMTCGETPERNDLYIIFSPNNFSKANSEEAIGSLPRQLTTKKFNEWLAKTRKRDKDMCVDKKILTICK